MEELNLGLLLYFYSIWDNFGVCSGIFLIISIFAAVLLGFILITHFKYRDEDEFLLIKKWFKISIIILVFSSLVSMLLPDKEYLPFIFFSDDLAKVVTDSLTDGKLAKINEILELKLDELLTTKE